MELCFGRLGKNPRFCFPVPCKLTIFCFIFLFEYFYWFPSVRELALSEFNRVRVIPLVIIPNTGAIAFGFSTFDFCSPNLSLIYYESSGFLDISTSVSLIPADKYITSEFRFHERDNFTGFHIRLR